MINPIINLVLLIFILFFISCSSDDDIVKASPPAIPTEKQSIYEILKSTPELSECYDLVKNYSLTKFFLEHLDHPKTFFAFTNSALENLKKNPKFTNGFEGVSPDTIQNILNYHIVDSTKTKLGLVFEREILTYFMATLPDYPRYIKVLEDGSLVTSSINKSIKIINEDIKALNGMVHIIDDVLIPKDYSNDLPKLPATVKLISIDSLPPDTIVKDPGSKFSAQVGATKGDANLVSWVIKRDGIAIPGISGNAPDPSNFYLSIPDIPVPANEGTYLYSFEVTDSDGEEYFTYWPVFVIFFGSFTEYTNITLGTPSNTNFHSIYNLSTGLIYAYSMTFFFDSTQYADILYYVDVSNGPTLWSPADWEAYSICFYDLCYWSTRNNTKIQLSSLIYSDVYPIDLISGTVSGTKVNHLSVGNSIIFETINGRKGILEITSISPGTSGSITFNSKVIN